MTDTVNDNEFLFDVSGRLGLCGCGYGKEPKFALLRQVFALFPLYKDDGFKKLTELVGGNETVASLLIDWLDRAKLAEHGGSTFGSWRTRDGDRFHALLQGHSDADLDRLSESVPPGVNDWQRES